MIAKPYTVFGAADTRTVENIDENFDEAFRRLIDMGASAAVKPNKIYGLLTPRMVEDIDANFEAAYRLLAEAGIVASPPYALRYSASGRLVENIDAAFTDLFERLT